MISAVHRKWIIGLCLVPALAACGGSGGSGAASSTPIQTDTAVTPTFSASNTSAPIAAGAPNNLVGLGATAMTWDVHHIKDASAAAGTAYDPTPGLPSGDPDRYMLVLAPGGVVTSYTLNFASAALGTARQSVRAELPADAQPLWGEDDPQCRQEELRSDVLASATGTDGMISIGYYSEDVNGNSVYDAGNINQALLAIGGPASQTDAPGC